MLERNRFAIQSRHNGRGFDILDADTSEIVGTAIEKCGFLTRCLRCVLPRRWRPTFVEVSEKPDDSLVFTIHRGWQLFSSRLEVRDSQDQLVGTLHRWFRIQDKADNRFASTIGRVLDLDFNFASHNVELGRVSKNPRGCTLEVNQSLAHLPLSKMLLLAATLAITLSA